MIYYGLVLIGAYVLVTGVSGLSYLPSTIYSYDIDAGEFVVGHNWWIVAIARLIGTLFFSVVPGVLLIRYASSISERFSKIEYVETYGFSDAGLYVVAFLFLSVFFGVSGLSSMLSGIAQLAVLLSEYGFEYSGIMASGAGALANGLMKLVASVALYYHSLGAVRPAA